MPVSWLWSTHSLHPRLPLTSSPRLFLNKSVLTGLLKWMMTSYSGWTCHFLTVGIQVQLHMWVIPHLSIPFPSPLSPPQIPFLFFPMNSFPSLFMFPFHYVAFHHLYPFFSSSSPAQGEDCHHEDPPCGVITIPLENPPCCTMYISNLENQQNSITSIWY